LEPTTLTPEYWTSPTVWLIAVSPGDALHLDVAQVQAVDRLTHAVQLDSLTGRLGHLHRGAAPEVDAHVQAGNETRHDRGDAQNHRQHRGEPGVFDEMEIRLLRQQFDEGPSTHRHHSAIGSFLGLAVLSQ
jgi:hypothetical protein